MSVCPLLRPKRFDIFSLQAKDPAAAILDNNRPEVDGGGVTDGEDGGSGGTGGVGDARDIESVRASEGRGVFYVESKPAQVNKPAVWCVLYMLSTCSGTRENTRKVSARLFGGKH